MCLHRLATQTSTVGPSPRRTTTLFAIQNALIAAGVVLGLSDIRTSLEVLAGARIELTASDDAAALLLTPIAHLELAEMPDALDAVVTLQFNPLVALSE